MDVSDWVIQCPKYTTFRINILKPFNSKKLQETLVNQSIELNAKHIPDYNCLKQDCLILSQWDEDVGVETSGIEVVVDAACAAAVLRGAHVFAPAVMSLTPNCKAGMKVDIYGDLEGKCKRGLKVPYDGEKLYVGTGILKMSRFELFDNGVQPKGIAIHTLLPASKLPVVNETMYPKGYLLLQNLPSIVCSWVLNAQADEYILDMCAAPGNKTTHLGEMSKNKAFIIAIDKTPQKVLKIQEKCEAHGVTCVTPYCFDSTKCCSEDSSGINGGPPLPPDSFDKILLDAPCSGLGQRPQLGKKVMSLNMLKSYTIVQKLMTNAVKLLKPGGRLVYSTCTTTVDENEALVSWALEKFPNLKLIPAEPFHGGPGLPGVGLSDEQRVLVQRFGPEIDELRLVEEKYRDHIGFFIAAFSK
ncbi:LOW QUALITY PROTEIN: tRNA (cytosine(72)-C(5))-methyltransferase NSUN6-like [Manduca sexta]|uniref:LOW QUALITY PROTEIN: tRNA (cytosine(72)-C(5))-methyltransferase NSUN6-like n=1 Tax=Manduca sexta TaxID=7130 RepID=UPI00188E6D72|nr:LOW QUALITY PROTEIN: tRNA (cytosine(72)-C(5))-methyltransferase NSUN6-like [Manduca sexta]